MKQIVFAQDEYEANGVPLRGDGGNLVNDLHGPRGCGQLWYYIRVSPPIQLPATGAFGVVDGWGMTQQLAGHGARVCSRHIPGGRSDHGQRLRGPAQNRNWLKLFTKQSKSRSKDDNTIFVPKVFLLYSEARRLAPGFAWSILMHK